MTFGAPPAACRHGGRRARLEMERRRRHDPSTGDVRSARNDKIGLKEQT